MVKSSDILSNKSLGIPAWHHLQPFSCQFDFYDVNCPLKPCFCLIWFFTSQSTIFQLCWEGSSWVEPVLSKDKCGLLKVTKKWHPWGSNQRPLSLPSNTLPLSHCAPNKMPCNINIRGSNVIFTTNECSKHMLKYAALTRFMGNFYTQESK